MTSTEASPPVRRSAIDLVFRDPAAAMAVLLCFHIAVWTVLPILVCPNLQLDLAEGLALGREWQLGYWKHPPLPWWLTDLVYRMTGQLDAVYVLGPLSAAICLFVVWRLARCVTGPVEAFAAVLALEGIHFYNFSVVKFAHDQMQLPIWALTGYFYFRALTRARISDWILAGVFLALAFWAKYAAFALAATLGLFLLLDPRARRSLATPGPWLMAAAFLVTLAPNLWWLVTNDFLPFRYVDARAATATKLVHYVIYPVQWAGGQIINLLPAIGLLALWLARRTTQVRVVADADAAFARRMITAMALGPFLVTTIVAAVLGRLPIAMWGYPLWSFAPLAVLLWFGPIAPRRLRSRSRQLPSSLRRRLRMRRSSCSNPWFATGSRRQPFRDGRWRKPSPESGEAVSAPRWSMSAAPNSQSTTSPSTRPTGRM
jgi:hypothetical protein